MPGRLVLADDTLVDHGVDYRNSVFVRSHCRVFVAGVAGIDDSLDFGTHKRPLTHVSLAGLLGLARALAG